MRNEMETNLPREPANLEGLKDTLTHRTHTHLQCIVTPIVKNIMCQVEFILYERTNNKLSFIFHW